MPISSKLLKLPVWFWVWYFCIAFFFFCFFFGCGERVRWEQAPGRVGFFFVGLGVSFVYFFRDQGRI